MTTSFRYQSPRVEEETAYLDLNLPNVAVDDFSFMSQLDTYPAADCDSIDFSKLDIPLDNSFWDNFDPDLFASAEPSFPPSTSASNDLWSTDINSLHGLSPICFDTPQMGHALPNRFSRDTTYAETALPSSDSDDSNLRLTWVRSTLKDLALAKAAKDTRPVSQKTKQIDASIELYLQLQNDLGSGFQEDCDPAAQSMVWQHSSTSTTGSWFDNNSFSVTGSPSSSTGTVPELSPTSSTRAGSASAVPSRAAEPSATGGVQMILDMNLNETTSLPRKHRPKTREERQRYIAVRRQGACDWHRKQRKRCTCVDKTESAITTVKRKPLMKHVKHCSGAIQPVSSGGCALRNKVRAPDRSLESWLTQDECLVPKVTWQCCRGQPCNDPQCAECCCGSDEPITQRLQTIAHPSDAPQLHTPFINRGTLSLIERQPWGEPLDYDQDPGYVLHSPAPDILERPISPYSQNTIGLSRPSMPVQDRDNHIIASPGRPSPYRGPQVSLGDSGEARVYLQTAVSIDSTPTQRHLDASIFAPIGAGDRLPSSRLTMRRSDNVHLSSLGVDVEAADRHAQSRSRSQHDQIDRHALAVHNVVRLISRSILRLATRSASIFSPPTTSRQRCHPFGKWEIPRAAIRNKTTSRLGWREQSTNFEWLLLIWACLFVSPILAIAAFLCLPRVARCHSISSELTGIMEIIRMPRPAAPPSSLICAVYKSTDANLSSRQADNSVFPDWKNAQPPGPWTAE
ncbi:hypothetical protein EMCG_07500 [[Emmonsia] crescens]|uniref:Uncharacterized protein n=1 Tax=[Emmonsia] crescens TaxID=73230 RepID=A0A0G2JB39_9EURO|nr:hypothetical protein EMCG_07500 [Emmonsia crescens UAMH 3008]